MTATTIRVQMAQRKDTAANWTAANPILLSGEIGYETDTKKFKIGDGTTNWNSLAYLPIPDGSGNLTITGNLEIGTTGSLTFEGSTANGFETTLAVTDPTADRTITLPNVSGTVVTTGDTGSVTSTMLLDGTIVDADISGSAEIAVSKLANGTANQVIVTDGTNVSWSDNLTLAGDLTVNGTTTTINTENLLVEDKNIIIGDVATPSDVTADGGGITLKGTTDKTINWVDSTDAWTSSERFSYPLGSATAPALTFTGDPNTGIYSPGADQVAISTSGTGRLIVGSTGTVNIVGAGTAGSTQAVSFNGSAPVNSLVMLSDGKVGLGTSTPDAQLYVAAAASTTNPAVRIASSGSLANNLIFRCQINGLTNGMSMTQDASSNVNYTFEGGRVGIGTTSPFALLHVKADTNKNLIVQNGGADTIEVSNYNAGDGYRELAFGGSVIKFNTGTAGGGSSLERGRFDASGRLLVGTSSAGNGGTLCVNGTSSIGGGSTGAQSSMSKVGMERTSSVTTSAKTIFTGTIQGLSSAAAAHIIVYGNNDAGAGFLDVVAAKSGGTVAVISSSTIEGSPAARTYTMSSDNLQLQMASGTYNTNVRCTSMGYPF